MGGVRRLEHILSHYTRGGTKPVSVGRKGQGVDVFPSLERVEVLSLMEVPEHGVAVFSSGGA